MTLGTARVIRGNALALPLEDESVDLICTSPPYWSLRQYTDGGVAYEGQIGGEDTPGEFIDNLVAATAEMVRVLKPTGSIWINLGDRYDDRGCLMDLPHRYAIRAVDDLGLTKRSEVVWSKGNAYIDAKVTDRPRRTHETWFHLTTGRDYFSNLDALRTTGADYRDRPQYRRAMWLFTEAGFSDEHMAAVRAVGIIDSDGGRVRSGGSWSSRSGRLAAEVRTGLRSYYRELCGSSANPRGQAPGSVWEIDAYPLKVPKHLPAGHYATFPVQWPMRIVTGWSAPGMTVLDPCGGTGTTALAAKALGRTGISLDMSADYCAVARWRTTDPGQLASAMQVDKPAPVAPDQLDLLEGLLA
jgi:DNA modification methylase